MCQLFARDITTPAPRVSAMEFTLHRRALGLDVRFNRLQLLLGIVILATLSVFYYLLAVHAETPLLDSDDAIYMLMADYFSPFSNRPTEIVELVMRHSLFPPLYPMLLGWVGADSSNLGLSHLLTISFMLSAVVVIFFLARRLLGSPVWAGALAVLFALLPSTIQQSFSLLSENLYLLLSLAAVYGMTRMCGDMRWAVFSGAMVALSCLTRSIGVTLLLAYLFCLPPVSRNRRIVLALSAIMPSLLWLGWKAYRGYHGAYSAAAFNIFESASLSGFVSSQWRESRRNFVHGWVSNFDYIPSSLTWIVMCAIGAFCLAGAIYRARQKQADGIYVLVYLLLIAFWPYSYEARRFFYPIVPVLLIQGFIIVMLMVRRYGRYPLLVVVHPYLYLLLIGLTLLPSVMLTAERFRLSRDEAYKKYAVLPSWYSYSSLEKAKLRALEQYTMVHAWERLNEQIGKRECVFHIKPIGLMFYSNRKSYITPWMPPDERETFGWQTAGCRYYYVTAYVYGSYRESFYPLRYLRNSRVLTLDYVDASEGRRLFGMLIDTASHEGDSMKNDKHEARHP